VVSNLVLSSETLVSNLCRSYIFNLVCHYNPTPPPPPPLPPPQPPFLKLSHGALAGSIIGGLLGLGFVTYVVWLCIVVDPSEADDYFTVG
jgi:hypothetical protein